MAIQKPNSRRLLNKDEEDERKASEKFFLPTLEELTAIEEKAKEDAAAAVSSKTADPMRNRNDLGRVAMQSAKQEMLAEHENAVNEQKRKVERAKQEYEAYPVIDRIGLGSSSLMADIARDNIKKQENEYDRMTMTEPEYAKKHKADFGESVEQIVQSAGYGAAKSFGQTADVISATGAGLKSAGKWLGGEGDDESSAAKEFTRGFQNRLADTEKSLYDEIDAEYQRERQRNAKVNGELNVFAGYVDQAAHSVGEQALMYWTASMSSALFGSAKVFSAISSKADDLAKSGKKGMQMLGQALGKINAGSVGGATSMLITSSAQSTKEAILDMRQQNEAAAAYGMPKMYTDDEIMEKSALFGFLNGLSEVGLEYAIGGITGAAGGILPKGKVKNPFLTATLSYLKGSAGEGFEESVQTLASTGLKRAVYDQTAEVDWREVLDSGIVGALTGFGMGAPSFIRNTSIGVSAMRDVSNTAKATNRVNTDAQAGIVASASAAKAKAYGQMAEQVRNTDSENADTVASIYEWAAGRQQEIADAMADDTKRKQIIEENAKKSAEDTQAAIQRMRDTNPDFAETERTGLASGAKAEDIRMAGELSSVLGKKIRFFSEDAKNGTINNGEYHEDTGEIWINARSRNVKAQIVAHELTHSIEKKDSYQQLVDLTMNKLEEEQKAKGKTLDDMYREKETLYADGGVRLASYDEITSELVAEFVERRLLTDEASIKSLVSENRTLGQRIREWFDSLLVKLGNASAKEREYIRQMRDMYARALGEDVSAETSADGKVRHSFVGESANIDKSQLAVAKQMEADGKTDEEIYAETGWYKQSDGKWRMEIMDEIAEPGNFSRDGHETKKSEKEIRDFAEAEKIEAEAKALYESGEYTQGMYDSLMRYAASFREKYENKGKLTKYLNAPKLFNAYPALENVTLEFRELPDQVLGWSFSELNEIFIDDKQIEKYGQSLEEVLAHEIQHFIQDMEGFEQGTNPEAAGSEEDYYNAGGEIEARDVMDRLRMSEEERRGKMPVRFSISASEIDGSPIDAERISSEEGDVRYSITYAPQIEESQKEYIDKHRNVNVTDRELEEAHRVTEAMVDVMMKYSDILPEDKIGKVLTKNGSYDRSVENTTICVRTLAYNEFVDRVQAQIGRPLTQMESFLVSQKLYDIATDPQCMYCYVSLDRKSYNEMLLRYMQDRDTVIDKYNKSDKTPAAVESLYEEFLAGRKDTKNMRDRFNKWISYADNGTKLLSMADIATEARQTEIRAKGDQLADQLKDARAYAQSASWSKIQKDYVAYRDEILKLGDRVVKDLNEHYGMRWYSFSDYSAAFIVENMQQITDAAIRGLKGLSYTKDTDFAKIFAPSGMNINISVFVKQDKNGNYYIDDRQSADFEEALALREEYPNVGIVATVTDDGALRWAGEQEWSDVIIPFHIVRTGTDVASFYKWLNYTAESGDTIKDQNLWDAYVDSLNPKTEAARKKVSKNVYPSEHHNDKETYLNLCESRGLTPRFARFAGEDWYMKLVNETRRSADETPAMKPVFNEAAAKESFAKFVDKGGYSGGWYREGVDVDAEAKAVAADVLAGKKADEVSYGRQDVDAESLMARRKSVRSHGVKHSVSREDASVTEAETDQTLLQIRNDIAADEARYRELSDTVMSNERFNAMMPDEQNAILDEMQSLRERIDRANQIMQDMSYEQDMGDDVPVPTDGDVPAEDDGYHGMKAMNHPGDDAPAPTDEDVPEQVKRNGKLKEMLDAGDDVPMPTDGDAPEQEKRRKGLTAEKAEEHLSERQKKRGERKTVAKAETAFKRLGYDIAGAIVDNYEDAAGIIEDDKLASQAESDINKYVKDNNIQFYVDNTAKLLALGQLKPENVGLKGEDLKHAKLLADMYRQFEEVSGNSIREQGKKNTNIVNEELDDIFRGYDWFTEPDKKQKRLREQLQLSLANPEQVMRDVFGDAKIVKDEDGSERLLNVAERLNEYIIRPTIENSARARRQTNQMVSGLRDLGLTEAESGITQIFAEYSDTEESKSKKPTISESDLRYMLMTKMDADGFAEQIARKEYGEKETKEKKEFRDSIVEQLQNEINVNEAKARQRALRDHKAKGGTNASWNALSENERNAKIDAAYKTVTDESIGRIVNGSKELRKLLDDMYEAINAVSVIHGAAPIPFRKGYMPHSHRQTEELQKWFNDHMGGLNVTPVQDLPTDIAGKTADRKPNKRWFSHAQQRTGPRTTWDALGNVEDYLRIANDTIYHMDDIRKMRVLERYIRGIYSVARGATGEQQRTRVKNDVMQRLHGEDVDLVFLGLQPPEKKQKISDEDMDLSQMTTFVTWLTNYTNDLAAKQIFNRDIEAFAGRKVNNLANTLTSWSSRTMMQYNISSNLKQLSQLGTVSGDVGARISKDAATMTLRSMRNLGNGTNELEQKYHISERSTFLAEKEAIEEATFASDKELTEKQKTDRQHAKDIWDYAWSMTDTTMSRYAVYAYFMEGMNRGMDDTAALRYADTKARNILASRMKGSSPLIFQSKNPTLRMLTLFQREPLAAWQDILKTMPREYSEMKTVQGEKTAKEQITKRITGRLLGAGIVNTVYATVLGLGTPAMFDIFGEPLRALLDKLWKDITPEEEDDITFKEMAERYISTLGDEIADDIPFANVVSLISNTYAGTEFESRLALNAPDLTKVFDLIGHVGKAVWNGAQLLWSDDAKDIELLEEIASEKGQIPVAFLDMVMEIVGAAAPAGNQIRKSAKGLIAVLRSGEYTKDGKLKYEVGGVGDSIRAVLLGSSNTRAGQEWIASGFDSLSKTETEAYKALIGAGVSEKRARQYVERVAEAEKVADETQAQAEARMIDRMTGLNKQQKAELYYDMVATDNQRAAVDAAVGAGAKIDDAVETARAIRDSSKKLDRLTALQASDMDTDAREEMYLAMVATKVKDTDGNVIGTEDDDTLEALYTTGLDFDDFLDAKQMQSVLNANESLTANQRASRFLAWTASQGYTDAQAEVIGENFGFSSGFRVKSETYQKIVDSGVTAENAVKVTDAIAGKTKTADKINAVWSTGLSGNQLDLAVKSVLSEKAYERYRIVVDANIPLEIYTWALLNADQDAEGEKGHGSVNNTERELILSQLALPRKDLSALWLALGGSEKSNPYSGTPKVTVPKVEVPKIEMPKIELPKIGG